MPGITCENAHHEMDDEPGDLGAEVRAAAKDFFANPEAFTFTPTTPCRRLP